MHREQRARTWRLACVVHGLHGPSTTRMGVGDARHGETYLRHVPATSRGSLASFSGPIWDYLVPSRHRTPSCAFGVWLRFSPFSPSVEFCSSATEMRTAKWTAPPAGTTPIFDI